MKMHISSRQICNFNKEWPGSIIPEKSCWFEYDTKGNLVDMSHHLYEIDAYELKVLSEDAYWIGRRK